MRLAYERYFATPEGERVYRPDEAVPLLVRLVAMTIAVASARAELDLVENLPDLLEPFAPLNELVDIVWKNAIATRETMARVRPDRGRELWIEVYERLGTVQGVEAEYVNLIRNAVAFGLGTCEAWMGMQSATSWAERLDDVPLQRVSALQLRRTVRIQLGDWEAAERLRKEAEILALQAQSRQMFPNVLQVEINAFALAGDMTALKQSIDRARTLAATAPGWVPTVLIAEGRFQVLCSNFQAALGSAESALALLESKDGPVYPLGAAWCGAVATRLEALIGLERYEEARSAGEQAIAVCKNLEIGVPAHDISRALALAEARLGEFETASARLSQVIQEQLALGISGLRLGASYEARARVAIWARDAALAEEYMRHTAREYRYGQGSALGARYERLVQEAQRIAGAKLPSLSEFESSNGSTSMPTSATVVVTEAMKGAGGATERAERALDLLCDERAAAGGFLYLFKRRRLRLVASRGARRPPQEFSDFLTRFLAHELADIDAATRVLTEPLSDEEQPVEKHYTDSLGLQFYPVLLRGTVGDESRYAGVVAFGYHGAAPQVDDKLVVALSTHFIESGYSDALDYGDWEAAVED
jgi:tetratricopeptide (TPR) repeat protein